MQTKLLTPLALLFAMTFPTLAAWSYFLGLASTGPDVNRWQQAAYIAGKIIQFSFPIAFLVFLGRRDLHWAPMKRQPARSLKPGLLFGLAVAAVMLGAYFGGLRGSSLLRNTPARLQQKLHEVGMDTPARYAVLAVFIVAAHSLLEEYYWRWFVFGGLRQFLSMAPAMALSSLAFMAHHVVVLYVYLPSKLWSAVLPFALAIAVGGAVWAWLYDRGGSLWAPWLSHLLVDAAIFAIGWDLLWPVGH